MEWLTALMQADATKLAMLAVIVLGIVIALPRVVQVTRVWKSDRIGDEIPDRLRRFVDERATHKANSAVLPFTLRLDLYEEKMRKRDADVRELEEKAIKADLEIRHGNETMEELRAGLGRLEGSVERSSDKLNRILGHLGIPS